MTPRRPRMQTVSYYGALQGDLAIPPTALGKVPAVLCIHGTGWWGGRRTDWDNDASRLAQAGYLAMSADYSLAPPHGTAHFDQPVDELEHAIAYLSAHSRSNG